VNGSNGDTDNDKPVHFHHHHHHHEHSLADSSDSDAWQQQSSGDAGSINGVSGNDVVLTLSNSADIAGNGVSTLSASDTNGTSTASVGDSISNDGSFNGFIVAMHRKMVSRLCVLLNFVIRAGTECRIFDRLISKKIHLD